MRSPLNTSVSFSKTATNQGTEVYVDAPFRSRWGNPRWGRAIFAKGISLKSQKHLNLEAERDPRLAQAKEFRLLKETRCPDL